MNQVIIRNWNQRVKKDDIVYHLGDFCFKGGIQGGKTKSQFWEEQLNGKIIFIKGNHDDNNGVKSLITSCILEFGGKIIYATHVPPNSSEEIDVKYKKPTPNYVDIILVGHVHEKWKHQWNGGIPVINVGVDIWGFKPVRLTEVIVYYDKIMKEKKNE